MSDEVELFARVAFYLPLAYIAYQMVMLRRRLVSPAWTRLSTGFVLVAILRALSLFMEDVPTIPYLCGLVVCYSFIAWGIGTLRSDVDRLYEYRRFNGENEP